MSVQVVLTCDGCGASSQPPIPFRLSRLGGLRLSVSSLWYVDGGTVACPGCRTEEQTRRIHSETHEARDLHAAAQTLGIGIERVRETTERWEVAA